MAKKQTKIIIIDAFALIFRAYYALPPLAKKDGTVVNAVYGFFNTAFNVLRDYKPDYFCVAFDSARPTFRKEMFPEYKAQRTAPPEDFKPQIPIILDLLEKLKIKTYAVPGFEADDVIGSICAAKSIDNKETISYILTGDLDTLQLVDDNTKVITFKRGMSEVIEYDEKAVEQKYEGLTPSQLIDMKALKGDQSDNIPGIRGIGEVTAIKLIKQFGTLEKLFKNIDKAQVSDRYKNLLRENQDEAMLSKKLVTIVTDVPLDFKLADCAPVPYDKDAMVKELQDLEFKSLIPRLPEIGGEKTRANIKPIEVIEESEEFNYQLVNDQKSFDAFLVQLKAQKEFVFDTESTSIDPFSAKLLGISFSWKEGEAYYLSVTNKMGDGLFVAEFDNSNWLEKLGPVFANPQVAKIGHNIKYDLEMLQQNGITHIHNVTFDTMIAAYLLSPGERGYTLDSLSLKEFGYKKISFEDLVGKGKEKIVIEDVDLEKISYYSCEDSDFTYRLYKRLKPKLKENKLFKVLEEIEVPLIPVLAAVEANGVLVDSELLLKLSRETEKKITVLVKQIYEMSGKEFNISSPNQLQEILFDVLQLSTIKLGKTKTGISTAASELEKLQGQHPIIDLIMEYRELTKLKSTYLDALPELVNSRTGRIHTSFNQTIAATGRLSSTNPNLQNIPVRTELGAMVRNAFIAPKGYEILSADYSQIELRLAAEFSGDKNLMKIFKEGKDVHTTTAAIIHGIPEEAVTKQIRSTAKEVNFGIIYGLGPMGLAQRTGLSRDEAKKFIASYFEKFPGIKTYIQSAVEKARADGYAETFTGRKRYLPDLISSNGMMRSAAERIAVNMPLQGASADLIKLAMIRIQEELPGISAESKMILQIHDQLLFEVPHKDLEAMSAFVKAAMENAYKFTVPIVVDISHGPSWGELK